MPYFNHTAHMTNLLICAINNLQIVDDVFAFMRSGHLTFSYGFNILRFLETETNFHVWDPAISGFTWLRNRLRHLPDRQAQFDVTQLEISQTYMYSSLILLSLQNKGSLIATTNSSPRSLLNGPISLFRGKSEMA